MVIGRVPTRFDPVSLRPQRCARIAEPELLRLNCCA
jgi:hypothetical protein